MGRARGVPVPSRFVDRHVADWLRSAAMSRTRQAISALLGALALLLIAPPGPASATSPAVAPPATPHVACNDEACIFWAPDGVEHAGFKYSASSAPGTASVPADEHVSYQPPNTEFTVRLCNYGGDGQAFDTDACSQPVTVVTPPPPPPSYSFDWDMIAACESGQRHVRGSANWAINTGNGYYGGLQMNMAFWRSYGGLEFAPRPDLASREDQITVAERAARSRGVSPWPNCGRDG